MSDSSDEDYYGPALPPSRDLNASGSQSDKISSGSRTNSKQSNHDTKRVIGPTMPVGILPQATEVEQDDNSINDEEAIVKDARHDWMAGMNERLELSLEHVSERDLERKLKREGVKRNEKKPVIETRPIEEKEHHFVEDRGPSLMEIHQRMRHEKRLSSKRPSSDSSDHHRTSSSSRSSSSSSKQSSRDFPAKHERKEFNPEEEFKIPRFDSKRSREMLKEAKAVKDRFGDPRWL